MRFLSTKTHALLDYGLGAILFLFPFVVGLNRGGLIVWGPMLLGAGLLLYSLVTNYEYSLMRLLPIKLHLALDAAGGLLLIIFAILSAPTSGQLALLLALGIVEIASSVVTKSVTSDGPGVESPSILTLTRRSKVAMPPAAGPKTADNRPNYPAHPDATENAEQLRGAIDSGRTGDKIAMTDPAAAPLGSDDEAAQPHDEEGLATARRQSARR